MNRRTFSTAMLAAPLLRIPGPDAIVPASERAFRSPAREFGSLTVEVRLAPTGRIACRWRSRDAGDPFDGQVGEFYVISSREVAIPDDLPGTITSYSVVVGYAAARGVIHVGSFRRDAFVWTVRVRGGTADHALEVAEFIAAVGLPDPMRVRLAPAIIATLLPEPDDFSSRVELNGA